MEPVLRAVLRIDGSRRNRLLESDGNLVCLLALLFPLGIWAWIRALTPPEGTVYKKVVSSENPEANRFLLFLMLWGIVAVAGVFAHEHYRPGRRNRTPS